jgi:hypothetical protein
MILRPTKYSHPDRTVINVSVLILQHLLKKRVEAYSNLLRMIKKNVTSGEQLFLPALSFLYLLGIIEYRVKTDAIEYVGSNETVKTVH